MNTVEKTGVRGIVRMELRDKYGNRKPLFQTNRIWEILKREFNLDLKIPFITGKWTLNSIEHNTVTNAGLSEAAKLLGGVAADPISHLAIGIGTGGTTTLNSEIATGGGERDAVTPTSETTSTSGDTVRSTTTFSFTSSFAVTEEGLFNDVSAGDMIAYREFSAINVANGDSLQITHDIVFSAS